LLGFTVSLSIQRSATKKWVATDSEIDNKNCVTTDSEIDSENLCHYLFKKRQQKLRWCGLRNRQWKTVSLPIQKLIAKLCCRRFRDQQQKLCPCRFWNRHRKTVSLSIQRSAAKTVLLPIQKSATMVESFLALLLSFFLVGCLQCVEVNVIICM